MYTIGIIDDKEGERADIQVSILENVSNVEEFAFKEYNLDHREKEELFQEIIADITEERIQTLIVDYKLDTAQNVIKGWEIVDFVHGKVPEFPVVILTNVPDESRESEYIDADKVYPKIIFLDTAHEETTRMVENILLNIQRYVKRRKDLEGNLVRALEKLDQNSTDEGIIKDVLKIEDELGKYKESDQTYLDRKVNLSEVKDILQELKEIDIH